MAGPVPAAAMLAGAALVALAPALPGARAAVLAVVAGLGVVIVGRMRAGGWLAIGAGLFALAAAAALDDRLPASLAGRDLVLEGRIVGVPDARPDRVRFLFQPDPGGAPPGVPSRLRLSWYDGDGRPAAGERWRLRVRLRPPEGLANPGAFDYERWLLERRIGATGYVRTAAANERLDAAGFRGGWARLRAAGHRSIHRVMGETRPAGIVAALTLGLRQGLDEDTRRVLRSTGTAHLMAISGLHVGMVAAVGALAGRLAWSLRWRLRPGRPRGGGRRLWAVLAGWHAAFAYTLLAGAGIPTRRALIMLSVGCLMLQWRRRFGPWTPLAAAVLVLFVLDPLTVLGAGFWLSVLAVAGLVGAGQGRITRPGPGRLMLAAQGAVALALAVPGLWIFGGLPAYGPLVNLAAVPLFGFAVVPLALIGVLALAIGESAAVVPWWLAGRILEAVLAGLGWIAGLRGAWLEAAGAPWWALLAAGLGAALLLAPLPGRVRASLLLFVVPAACWRAEPLPVGAYEVAVLDVGQGLAAVVRTRRHTLVFDTGPAWRGGGDTGAAVVAPYLRSRGIRAVDALVLSHGDNDHRGGARGLARAREVRVRWVGPDVPPDGRPARPCTAGTAWRWDGVGFRFLHPPTAAGLEGNDSSCVLLVAGPGGRTLLTGDIEAGAEAALLRAEPDLGVELVLAPHHGSRTSSTAAFVAATRPRWVVVPAGRRNRWDFPHEEVVARWQGAGARVWVTGEAGALRLRWLPDGPDGDPRGWRCESRRFWRRARCDAGPRVPGPGDSQYHSPDPAPPREGPNG